jgi:hypothetical protein
MAEETHTDVEDVQEDALLEDQEVVEEATEDSKEVSSLDETVLKVLIGESTEEDVEEVTEESEEAEEGEELEEAKHSKKEMAHAKKKKEATHEDDEEDEDEDEVKEMAHSKKKKEAAHEDDEDEDEDEKNEAAHEDEEEDDEEKAPKTKSESLNRLYKEMKGMKKSQLEQTLTSISDIICAQHESVEDDDNAAIAATVAAIKKSADDAKGKNKGDMLSAAYGMMKAMKKHNLQANYTNLIYKKNLVMFVKH